MDDLGERLTRLEQSVSFLQPSVKSKTDSNLGVTLINRVGAITLAIGIIFFFKYAVDEHLIGAWAGVLLGVLFGLALLAGGEWLRRLQPSIFAQGISGCGLASLYISLYAAVAFYKLMGETAGFSALAFVSALAFALSVRNRSAAIAMLGVIAALVTPLLLHEKSSSTPIEFGYLLLLNGTALAIAAREQWPALIAVAGALSLGTAWLLWVPEHSPSFLAFAVGLALLEFAAFWRLGGAIRSEAYVIGHAGVLLACLRFIATHLATDSAISQTTSVLLLLYGIAVLGYGMLRESKVNRRLGLVLVGLVILKLYAWDVWRLDRMYRITAFLGLGGLLLIASWVYSRTGKRT